MKGDAWEGRKKSAELHAFHPLYLISSSQSPKVIALLPVFFFLKNKKYLNFGVILDLHNSCKDNPVSPDVNTLHKHLRSVFTNEKMGAQRG